MTSKGNWRPGNRNFDAAFNQVRGIASLEYLTHYSGEAPVDRATLEPGVATEFIWRARHDTPVERPVPGAMRRTKEMAGDPLAIRKAMVRARYNSVASMVQRTPRVRVLPANDDLRKKLYHPTGRIGFLDHGSVEWPLDGFTQRRLRDGSITIEGDIVWGAAHPVREATNWQTRGRPPAGGQQQVRRVPRNEHHSERPEPPKPEPKT